MSLACRIEPDLDLESEDFAYFYQIPSSFRCNVPPLDNSSVYPGLTEEDILNYTTPWDGEEYNGCQRYDDPL